MSNFQKVQVWPRKPSNYLFLIALIFLAIGIYFRFEAFDVVRINEWVTRDFDRAFHLFDGDYIPLAGPERNAGGRLLGPFLYFFLAIPLYFNYSYESIYVFNLILNIASLIFFLWMIRKYFGEITGAFSSILLTVNIVHLDSAGFPINPTFMFPLTFIFLLFLFKVVIDNDIKYFPWIFVVISLGIQMHFSMAAYYLVPVVICLLFKININQKEIIKTIILTILCFVPYLIYKFQYYEPNIKITETFFDWQIDPISILKNFFILDIFRLVNSGIHLNQFYNIPPYISKLGYFCLFTSFYGSFFIVIMAKHSFEKYKKEIVVLLTFYIPAIVYAIMQPKSGWHFWHYLIFILPLILIKARFAYMIIEIMKNDLTKMLSGGLIVIFIGYTAFISFQSIIKINKFIDSSLKFSDFSNARNLKEAMGSLMEKLNKTPKEFYEQVYLEGISSGSMHFLEFAKKSLIDVTGLQDSSKVCFYGIEGNKINSNNAQFYPKENYRYNAFLADTSIKIGNRKKFIIRGSNFIKMYSFHPYQTKFNQPCYTNTKNPFLTEQSIRKYLRMSYKINQNTTHDSVIKDIMRKADYDKSSKVLKWEKTSLIFNPRLNTPIEVKISIDKKEDKYPIHVDLLYYSWGKNNNEKFEIKNLDLEIVLKGNPKNTVYKYFSIIEPHSWIARVGSSFPYTENFFWHREYELAGNTDLGKDNFNMRLNWEILFPNQKNDCCLKFTTKI
tara:strand:+ start:147 stop:2324 length:2178 start_codon:yes stop_codon:yes gene_type:complete